MADFAVVFVPGIIGTELTYQGDLIWPGTLWEMVGPYNRMKQLTSTTAVARNVIRRYVLRYPVYSRILDHLHDVLGNRVYECPYDWRLPNEESAKRVAEKVQEASQKYQNIVIVAHSMGGLISRHYLESGRFDSATGYRNVSALITLATPHYGSPFALAAGLGYRKEEFLSQDQVYELANNPEFPSVYQLLPPPNLPFVWRTDANLEPLDVYGSQGTAMLGSGGRKLQPANLDAAVKFWESFKKPANVRYFCFFGTQHGMINSISVSMSGGQLQAVLPDEIPSSGDGTVPSSSAVFGHRQSLAVGGDHVGMMGDPQLHSTLDQLLGITPAKALLLQIATATTISLRPSVVEVGARFTVLIKFAVSAISEAIVKGSIHIEPQAGLSLPSATVFQLPVEMPAPRSLCLEFVLDAPKVASFYHVTWSEGDQVLAQADLIVQSRERLSETDMKEFRTMSENLK
jgi:pimeloyl-ACP methyl ester carboxylesterase